VSCLDIYAFQKSSQLKPLHSVSIRALAIRRLYLNRIQRRCHGFNELSPPSGFSVWVASNNPTLHHMASLVRIAQCFPPCSSTPRRTEEFEES